MGANEKSQGNIEMLAKMCVIGIEKWGGPCWYECHGPTRCCFSLVISCGHAYGDGRVHCEIAVGSCSMKPCTDNHLGGEVTSYNPSNSTHY